MMSGRQPTSLLARRKMRRREHKQPGAPIVPKINRLMDFLDFLNPFVFFGNSHEPGAGMAGLLSWYPFFLSSRFWSFQLFERCSYNILDFFRFTLQIRAQSLVLLTFFFHVHNFEILLAFLKTFLSNLGPINVYPCQ